MGWLSRIGDFLVDLVDDNMPSSARTIFSAAAPVPVERPAPVLAAPANLSREYASPHFKWSELACKGDCKRCSYAADAGGPVRFISEAAIEKHEAFRVLIGAAYSPNSAARCPRHNAGVSGAPLSQHRSTPERPSTAFDIPLVIPKAEIIAAAEQVGFNGIGLSYRTFVHIDNRPRRARW